MAYSPYLAMTAAQIGEKNQFPHAVAWMACHFSPGGTGLSNLPGHLPAGSVLLMDDSTPLNGHDHRKICGQLFRCVEDLHCTALLLDFQRPDRKESQALAHRLTETLPCPVAVPPHYGAELDCPLFLPPVPPSVALRDYISPWKGRALWLELALDAERITVTEEGSHREYLPHLSEEYGFPDKDLHCHYHVEVNPEAAVFTLWRNREDLLALAAEAQDLGINCVGLYQELIQC